MELADKGFLESFFCFPRAARNRGVSLGSAVDPGRHQVLLEPAVEVVADGDLALLAPLFPEPQDALGALVLEVAAAEPGEGADAGPGVGQHAQHGPISQSHDTREVDGGEQVPGLLDGELGGLAVHDGVLPPPHGGERVQSHGMADDQGIEEMPQRRQRQILGGVRSGNLLNEAPGQPRRDLTQLDSLFLAPGEEAANDDGRRRGGCGGWRCGRRRTHRRRTGRSSRRAAGRRGCDRGPGRRAEGRIGKGFEPW